MRVTLWIFVFVVLGSGVATAQPGQTPPTPYLPPAYGYRPAPVPLSASDQELLQDGEISDGQQIGGGLLALFVGFGSGQAAQGRWHDTGWIFTLGELGSLAVMVVGLSEAFQCDGGGGGQSCGNGDRGGALLVGGMLGAVGFHVWEVVDAFAGPPRHNARLRDLRQRLGYSQPMYTRIAPFVAPAHGDGMVGGLTLRF